MQSALPESSIPKTDAIQYIPPIGEAPGKGVTIDILMITYNRPEYTRLSLARLLSTCGEAMRVWIWHNGNHGETLEAVKALADHPRVHEFHHSAENKKLREPTNWLWTNAKGEFLGKVDDDCLMPEGWAQTLLRAHNDVPEFGVLGCWQYREEDFVAEVAERKVERYPGGHRVMRNCWVGGSGYIMKRSCVDERGLLRARHGFTRYCVELALRGWIHGWYYPFIYMEHMDDPRSPHTRYITDEDFQRCPNLSALKHGVSSLSEVRERLRTSSLALQGATPDPRQYLGWRAWLRRRFQ